MCEFTEWCELLEMRWVLDHFPITADKYKLTIELMHMKKICKKTTFDK